MENIPIAAAVPIIVAMIDEIKAMIKVLISAEIKKSFWKSCLYQSSVNPVHTDLLLDALNENIIRISIGVYRNRKIKTI
jgi:hypothetical protein